MKNANKELIPELTSSNILTECLLVDPSSGSVFKSQNQLEFWIFLNFFWLCCFHWFELGGAQWKMWCYSCDCDNSLVRLPRLIKQKIWVLTVKDINSCTNNNDFSTFHFLKFPFRVHSCCFCLIRSVWNTKHCCETFWLFGVTVPSAQSCSATQKEMEL